MRGKYSIKNECKEMLGCHATRDKDLKYVNEMILWFSPNAITANLWRTINITHIETLSEQWTGSRKWQRGQEQKEQAIKGWQKEWN